LLLPNRCSSNNRCQWCNRNSNRGQENNSNSNNNQGRNNQGRNNQDSNNQDRIISRIIMHRMRERKKMKTMMTRMEDPALCEKKWHTEKERSIRLFAIMIFL
jgi:hypothetical protein